VPGPVVVDRTQPLYQEMRDSGRLVTKLSIGPGAIVMHQKDLVGRLGMLGTNLHLCGQGKICFGK
jgi:hypothetical protein